MYSISKLIKYTWFKCYLLGYTSPSYQCGQLGAWFINDARLKELCGYYPDEDLCFERALAEITPEYRDFVATKLDHAICHNEEYD